MSLVLFLRLVCLFFFLVFSGSEFCEFLGLALLGVLRYFFDFLFPYPTLHISVGPSRSSVLRIGSDSTEASSSGWMGGEFDSLVVVVHRVALGEPAFPLNKGKGKISEIRYPSGSEYLRAAIQNVVVVGPSRVEPSYGEVFAVRYGPPFGVQVWCLDVLTSYVVQVPKMVCFFEVAFENGLRFPLHPFIKRVLRHFNVCPSQLSPNFWGILVGLLVVFRDRGLGVPSIALVLDFFSVKEAAEGFLYISKCSNVKLIISDLPSSHKYWKECYFFLLAVVTGSTIPLTGRTHLAFRLSGLLPRTYVSSTALWSDLVFKGCRIFLTLQGRMAFRFSTRSQS